MTIEGATLFTAWNPPTSTRTSRRPAGARCGCGSTSRCTPTRRHFDAQVTRFAEQRRRVDGIANPLLTAQSVKFFADGVVENETGALLAPYCSGLHSHSGGAGRSDSGENLGMRNWEGDSLALAARRVDEDDLQRFAALGVIPNMQPLWAQLDRLMTVLTIPRLGAARAGRQYPIRTLDTTGALELPSVAVRATYLRGETVYRCRGAQQSRWMTAILAMSNASATPNPISRSRRSVTSEAGIPRSIIEQARYPASSSSCAVQAAWRTSSSYK